jgi:hypothetical protein
MSVTLFVADLAEFQPLIKAAGNIAGVSVLPPKLGYWRIVAEHRLTLSRKELRLRHALWNSALSGGFCGRLGEYTNDVMTIESEG